MANGVIIPTGVGSWITDVNTSDYVLKHSIANGVCWVFFKNTKLPTSYDTVGTLPVTLTERIYPNIFAQGSYYSSLVIYENGNVQCKANIDAANVFAFPLST